MCMHACSCSKGHLTLMNSSGLAYKNYSERNKGAVKNSATICLYIVFFSRSSFSPSVLNGEIVLLNLVFFPLSITIETNMLYSEKSRDMEWALFRLIPMVILNESRFIVFELLCISSFDYYFPPPSQMTCFRYMLTHTKWGNPLQEAMCIVAASFQT